MTAKIKLNAASGGGSFSIQAPASSSNNRVITLPDTDDFVLSTNRPAFNANLSTTTNFSSTPTSTVPFDTEAFDLGGCFNHTSSAATLNGISVPAHSFLPNVAGTYFVSCIATINSSTAGSLIQFNTDLVKNSTVIGRFDNDPKNDSPDHIVSGSISIIVDMNGTSDFLFVRTTASASGGTLRHLANDGANLFSAYKLII